MVEKLLENFRRCSETISSRFDSSTPSLTAEHLHWNFRFFLFFQWKAIVRKQFLLPRFGKKTKKWGDVLCCFFWGPVLYKTENNTSYKATSGQRRQWRSRCSEPPVPHNLEYQSVGTERTHSSAHRPLSGEGSSFSSHSRPFSLDRMTQRGRGRGFTVHVSELTVHPVEAWNVLVVYSCCPSQP